MQLQHRHFEESAAGLAKVVALAFVLALAFCAGRIVIAIFAVDGRADRTAEDIEISQLAYRHATSGSVLLATDPPAPFEAGTTEGMP